MTKEQQTLLIICTFCAVATAGAHLAIRNWAMASLVALAVSVGGTAFWVWQRAESAFWIIALVIALKLAAGVTMAVSVVCIFVRLQRKRLGGPSSGDGGKGL